MKELSRNNGFKKMSKRETEICYGVYLNPIKFKNDYVKVLLISVMQGEGRSYQSQNKLH